MKGHAGITWDGKMMADVEKVSLEGGESGPCQRTIQYSSGLMSKTMFNTRISPVRILVVFYPNANPTVAIGKLSLLMSF